MAKKNINTGPIIQFNTNEAESTFTLLKTKPIFP